MPAPYSNDLRWKVVNAYKNEEGDQKEIAQRFSVSLSFVKRLWKRYQTNQDIKPAPFGGWKRSKIDRQGEETLRQWLREEGDLTLAELCERYQQQCGRSVSTSAMGRPLRKMKVSRKKNALRPPPKERTGRRLKESLSGIPG
jgi:transposase